MLMLKIETPDGETAWHKTTAANPDDALAELEFRGLYSFEAGDRLRSVLPIAENETGYKIGNNESDAGDDLV